MLLEALRNGLHFGSHFHHRDAGLHSPNRPILMHASGSDVLPAHIQWNPDVDVYRSQGSNPSRQDAHDGVLFVVQLEGCSHGVLPAAEMPLPEAGAEQDNVILSGLIFTLLEGPSEEWRDAEEGEEVCLGFGGGSLLGFTCAAGVDASPKAVETCSFQGLALRLPIEIIPARKLVVPRPILALPELHEPVGIMERKRAQQNGINDAENGRVRANSKCQRQRRHDREAGVLRQHAQAVAKVLPKGLHGQPPTTNNAWRGTEVQRFLSVRSGWLHLLLEMLLQRGRSTRR